MAAAEIAAAAREALDPTPPAGGAPAQGTPGAGAGAKLQLQEMAAPGTTPGPRPVPAAGAAGGGAEGQELRAGADAAEQGAFEEFQVREVGKEKMWRKRGHGAREGTGEG